MYALLVNNQVGLATDIVNRYPDKIDCSDEKWYTLFKRANGAVLEFLFDCPNLPIKTAQIMGMRSKLGALSESGRLKFVTRVLKTGGLRNLAIPWTLSKYPELLDNNDVLKEVTDNELLKTISYLFIKDASDSDIASLKKLLEQPRIIALINTTILETTQILGQVTHNMAPTEQNFIVRYIRNYLPGYTTNPVDILQLHLIELLGNTPGINVNALVTG